MKRLPVITGVILIVLGICGFSAWWVNDSIEQMIEQDRAEPPTPQGTPAARTWPVGTPVEQVRFRPDGRLVAVLQQGGTLTLRGMPGGEVQAQVALADVLTATVSNTPTPFSRLPSPAATPGKDGEVPTRETSNIQEVMAFNRDGTLLAASVAVHIANCVDSFSYPDSPYACPQGESGSWETATSLWRVEPRNGGSFALVPSITLTHTTFPAYYESVWDEEPIPWSLAFSPDGTTLAAGNMDGTVVLWEVNTGRMSGKLPGSPSAFRLHYGVVAMAWSADGRTLYAGDYDEVARRWRIPEGELLYTNSHSDTHSRGHSTYVSKECYLFSADLEFEATASWAYEIALWQSRDGSLLRTIGNPEGEHQLSDIHSLAFSPNSKLIASGGGLEHCDSGCGSSDPSVRIWRVADGRQVALYSGHVAAIDTMDWSPDGRTLVSGSYDGKVMLWDVSSLH